MIARQEYGRRLPDRDGEHAHARCFPSPAFRRREYCQALWCPFLYGIAYTNPIRRAMELARTSMRPEAEQR